ncbi:hypothetical protein FA95DRAFT_1675601 [Auriscalpium vulgare]|uniref:Uncharacterized protein n=1 Tax=Auriscalpium vulgare TaxID=40419 RepID=A0ACB8S7B5_9AGAM|nr:hypothetical protein FA95DRAFT_1675601 [Auriscalpium vulgare]
MADSIPYPQSGHYAPPYYPPPHSSSLESVPASRADTTQRRRPKYTRSKTGCMTCRVKKIKACAPPSRWPAPGANRRAPQCDETKPSCIRCVHGQRDCTWPEGVPQRKKPPPKRSETLDTVDLARPSTASSSGISDTSGTPPTRDHTPPKREHIELGLPPLGPRRHSDPHMLSSSDHGHRSSLLSGPPQPYPSAHNHSSSMLSVIPELAPSYLTLPPVDHLYQSPTHHYMPSQPAVPRTTHGSNYRYLDSPPSHGNGFWQQQSSAPAHLESVDSYQFSNMQDRIPATSSSLDTHPSRYH